MKIHKYSVRTDGKNVSTVYARNEEEAKKKAESQLRRRGNKRILARWLEYGGKVELKK